MRLVSRACVLLERLLYAAQSKAQTALGLPSTLFIVVPISELHGVLDSVTRDWADGLLSNISRDLNKPPTAHCCTLTVQVDANKDRFRHLTARKTIQEGKEKHSKIGSANDWADRVLNHCL